MKWIAVDIGNKEIKVSVRGIGNKPKKLLYNDNGRQYSFIPSECYCKGREIIYLGSQLSVLGALHPENLAALNSFNNKEILMNSFFKAIKEAAIQHYNDSSVGAVLLYEDVEENWLKNLAMSHFSEVQSKCMSEVLSSVLYKNEGVTLVIDLSMSAFKFSFVENGKKTAFSKSEYIGGQSVDMPSIIGYTIAENLSEVELYLHGRLIEKLRMDLFQGRVDGALLDSLNISPKDSEKIQRIFDGQIMKFFFGCFDACSQNLKKLSKNWTDVNNIVLCGGLSNYYQLSETIIAYLKGRGINAQTYKINTYTVDAQWAAAFAALQLPLVGGGVIIEY